MMVGEKSDYAHWPGIALLRMWDVSHQNWRLPINVECPYPIKNKTLNLVAAVGLEPTTYGL